MIKRDITKKLISLRHQFPVVAVLGPRQSGKTTLVKSVFPQLDYQNLEDPDTRLFAQTDPRAFLNNHHGGMIIDEAQRVPDLFSYIQTLVDQKKISGQFILTGSQNFLLHEKISQTLAGRIALLTLLPLSLNEIFATTTKTKSFQEYLYKGFYPALYDRKISPSDWLPNYVQTYIERDVRQLKNIHDLNSFMIFLKICAGRVGQILNITTISNEIGIAVNTVKSWLSILEASYVLFLLKPYYKNFNKRLVKSPKLYFVDTGLAASLLGIKESSQVATHYLKGALFENLIIGEFLKSFFNKGVRPELYYWRDKNGNEIDCLIEYGDLVKTIEIKAAQTITEEFFKGLNYWKKLASKVKHEAYIIYGGDRMQKRSSGLVVPWKEIYSIL